MKPPAASPLPSPFLLTVLLLLLCNAVGAATTSISISPANAPTSSPSPPTSSSRPVPSSASTLDPKQLRALQSLNIPTSKDPCSHPLHNATLCDSSSPFRHLLFLRLSNCSSDLSLSYTALKSFSSLHSLQFLSCPVSPIRFPSDLASSLRSFTCVRSLRKLTGIWLSRLHNLTDLTVSDVPVNTSSPVVILGNMKKLTSVTISRANLTGNLPRHWHLNLTYVDFSGNKLKGKIPTSITLLENLQFLDLSSNSLTGEMPNSFGDLISLKNASLASNSLSGSIPDTISALPDLVHLDLSSNQFNGTVPKFISNMKSLKYLNLEKNEFHGVLPFNGTFIKRLAVLKLGGNSNLCYNHSLLSSKLKLGIAPCDKHGLPLSPPPAKADSSADDSGSSDDSDYNDNGDSGHKDDHHHGPSKIVLGVAIGLSSIVFLIIFLVLLSKWCR